MLTVLQSILCVLKNLLLAIAWAGVEVINLLVIAIGALASLILLALPGMPDQPDPLGGTAGTAVGWLAWGFPVAGVVTAFSALLTTYALFLLVRIALRWVKAL